MLGYLGLPWSFSASHPIPALFPASALTVTGLHMTFDSDSLPHPSSPSLGWHLGLGPHLGSVLAEDRGGVKTVLERFVLPHPTPHICSSWEMATITIKTT